MKYTVTMKVLGEYTVSLEAESAQDARGKAIAAFMSADLGDLTNVDMQIVDVRGEDNDDC